MSVLRTPRLTLEPITLPVVEATFAGDRETIERLVRAKMPKAWPGRALVERAFSASLELIRLNPAKRLWGDRLMIARADDLDESPMSDTSRIVVGSVIFHGHPENGVAEVGYGVEDRWQRQGYASEATRVCVEWALAEPGVECVTATTPPWHKASIRVLERSGLVRAGTEEHEVLGEVLRFERRR
ncbi:MAG TPA: GNAT family N-acetyltransferase [Labilithrix sp.]|jgi:RimJ/RimL family protein N-acetyltransferase|nr:GNAT family N-acetyltransferase [Labilithrix sp.]